MSFRKHSQYVRRLTGLAALAMTCLSYASAQQQLQHHLPQEVAAGQADLLGPLPSDQQLHLSIVLPIRNQAALTDLLSRLYDPASPDYRHFLSVAQFTEQFGPTAADYQAVVTFAQSHGLAVTGAPANRMVVPVRGSVEQVEQTFHVNMNLYRHPTENRSYFSPDREPSLSLSVPVSHISGLNNFSLPQPMVKRAQTTPMAAVVTGSGPSASYLASDMRAAYYGGTTLTGNGQAVGLLEFEGYAMADVTETFASAGQSHSVPVNNVVLDGANGAVDSNNDGEAVLDIVQAIGMAPGLSQVRVYIGVGNDDANILNSMASENLAKSLGCSWSWRPDDPAVDDPFFEEFAAQGQSFFTASGDFGAFDASLYPFFYPQEDAYVTAVGGTHLVTSTAGGAWSSESVWNSELYGSGGGISPDGIAIPSWQSGLATAANGGSKTLRNVPDVAMEGDFDNYICLEGVCYTDFGGTSFAAPRWAGFMALVNQQAVEAGKAPSGGIGFLNPAIYAIGTGTSFGTNFHDITVGNNETNGQSVSYAAETGYDLTTGWGSARGQTLIDSLAGKQVPGFWIQASVPTISLAQGGSSSTTIAVTDAAGFTGSVTLALASALPSGVTAKWGTNPTTGTSVLTLTASATAAASTTQISLTGTSGTLKATTTITVTVHLPTFTLTSAKTNLQLAPGASVTSKITLTPEYGFTGSATLSVSGLPGGVTASFSPNPTSGASTLTLTASATAVGGTSSPIIQGTSGSVVVTTQLSLLVTAPTFQLETQSTINIGQGTTYSASVEIFPQYGFTGNVTLGVTGLPAGVTASFTPNPTPNDAQLVLTATSAAALGNHTLTITGTSGSAKATTTITLGVFVPTFTLAAPSSVIFGQGSSTMAGVNVVPEYGFSGTVNLAISGLPTGVSAVIAEFGSSGEYTVTLTASATAPVSTSTVTVTGTSGKLTASAKIQVQVVTPTFQLSGPATAAVGQGTSSSFSVSISPEYGFKSDATLSVSGLPAGVTATFSPNPTQGEGIMTLTASSTAVLGTYPLTLTASSGSQKKSQPISLGVFTPAFTLTTPGSIAIGQGSSTTTSAVVTQLYGFTGSVALVATGLPSGVTASFSPNPVTGTATMTLVAAKTAVLGAHTIKITGTFGKLTQSASFVLTTYAPTFTLTAPQTVDVGQGSVTSDYIDVNPEYGFTGSVNLSVSGLPAGVTATISPNPTGGYGRITFSASTAAVVGSVGLTITGTYAGQTATATTQLSVLAPAFSLSTDTNATLGQGSSITNAVFILPQNGFSGRVSLAVTGLPAGVTASFSPSTFITQSTMTLTASSAAALGVSKLTMVARSGALTVSTPFTLNVVSPGFTFQSYGGLDVGQGSTSTTGLSLNLDPGFTGSVKFTVTGLPSGVTATVTPNPAISQGTLTVAASSAAALGTSTLTITGTSGTKSSSTTLTLGVHKPSFAFSLENGVTLTPGSSTRTYVNISPQYGFASNVKFAISGLPAGVTATFTLNPAVNSSQLQLTAASTAKAGTTTATITGTSGTEVETVTFPVTIVTQGFAISDPSPLGVAQGTTSYHGLYVEFLNGFSGSIQLAVTGLPAGVTASFSPNPTTNGYTTMTLAATASAAAGPQTITITATSGTVSVSIPVVLQVYAPSFEVLADNIGYLGLGETASSTVQINSSYNFTGKVNLAVSGLPSGVTCTIAPNPGSVNGPSTLTLHAANTAALGQYTLTVTGTYGTQTSTSSFPLTIVAPSFSITGPYSFSLGRGQSVNSYISVSANYGFTGNVQLAVSGLPAGVAATFSANPLTPGQSVSMTLTASSTAAVGEYTATVTATSGTQTVSTQFPVNVAAPSFTISSFLNVDVGQGSTNATDVYINPQNGFTGNVTLAATTPTGVSGTFSTNPTTGYSLLTLAATTAAPLGQYNLLIKGTSGALTATTIVPLTVHAPSFSLNASEYVEMGRGTSATASVGVSPQYGFTGSVKLAVTGLPSGVTAAFAANPVSAASGLTVMTFTAASTATLGQYDVTITGTSGTLTVSQTVPVTISAPAFEIGSSAPVVLGLGTSTTSYVSTYSNNGFTGNVSFAISGLPSGVTASFAPNPVSAGGAQTALTLTASNTAALGQYSAVLTGSSGGQVVSLPLIISVYVPSFTLDGSGPTLAQGFSGAGFIYIYPQYGFHSPVTLSVSGLPVGASASFTPNPTVPNPPYTGNSELIVTTSSAVAPGSYSLTVTGTFGTQTVSIPVTMDVVIP